MGTREGIKKTDPGMIYPHRWSLQGVGLVYAGLLYSKKSYSIDMIGTSYTFHLIKREDGKFDIRKKFSITPRSQDIAVAGIVVFRNQKHEGYAISFPSNALQGSNVLSTLRSNPVGEKLNEYYRFLKSNESDIMSAIKNIREL